jgi:hypothetical protein
VTATSITSTGATISWNAGEPATGQVEFGTTSTYGQTSKLEASFNYQSHVQTLSGLLPGTRYHYRVRSADQAGNLAVSSDQVFSTTGSAGSPTPTPAPTPAASTPTPAPTPTPAAVPPTSILPSVAGLYGSGVAVDSKNNYQVGWTSLEKVSHRFRASQTSALVSIAVNQRSGSGYSGGNGGQIRASVQADVGGKPSGTPLASVTWSPGTGWEEKQDAYTFPSPATLVKGQLYHIVFENVASNPASDYVSLNETTTFNATSPRQPAFSDDFAVLVNRGSSWSVVGDTAVMDLTYANGQHDGNAYISALVDHYALVSGTSKMARERFTVSGGDRTVTSAAVRVKRSSGSSPLTIRLEKADGTLLASVAVDGTSVPLSTMPTPVGGNHWDVPSLSGGRWLQVTFPAVTLANGQTYNLVVSTASDTTYVVIPLMEREVQGPTWGSRAFRDGSGQGTTNGSSWADLYQYAPVDLQFYLQ